MLADIRGDLHAFGAGRTALGRGQFDAASNQARDDHETNDYQDQGNQGSYVVHNAPPFCSFLPNSIGVHIVKFKPWMLIALFLVLLCVGFCRESKAEVSIEAGPVFVSGDYGKGGALILSERFKGKYEVHMGYVSETFVNTCNRPDCAFDMRENLFAGAQRITALGDFRLGIGIDYFQNVNRALGCRFTAGLLIGYQATDRISLRVRHNSNAGSCTPNLGVDYIGVAWRFGE